ncbi:GNAT family N-acetyltransferase [Dyadobacter sp. CY312]|uniref:GNAT family N-acetyltransferase n=1 Tax=Dyadobacter sp. CY312 TaxID=2907303 RepID=UPI001F33F363|nr:GNAT family N-acetyltransferase [Dyadobacter sp. CY312]MCE7040881.1 GNAT family N-acetyltransferase [Dyadobacter sp. CY312]
MEETRYLIRKAIYTDWIQIFELYKSVSSVLGGLARNNEEITEEYVKNFVSKSYQNGVQFVVLDRDENERVVAEVHCYKLDPKVFSHVLSELTIAIDPDYQGMGLGKQLFESLLTYVQKERKGIYRIELIARESNRKAITLYEKLGFKKEGRMEGRIKNHLGEFEADIPMAWFNPNFADFQ